VKTLKKVVASLNASLNPSTPPEILAELSRDTVSHVRCNVAHNTSTPPEVLLILMVDDDRGVKEATERTLRKRVQNTHQSG